MLDSISRHGMFIKGNSSARAICKAHLRCFSQYNAQIYASIICASYRLWLYCCNSSARAIRKAHLRCFPAASQLSLLMKWGSAHSQYNAQIYASIICASYRLWLNCYSKYFVNCSRESTHPNNSLFSSSPGLV